MKIHNILLCYTKSKHILTSPPDLVLEKLTLISSNYPWLGHIFMVPRVFEPLKFYYILKIKRLKG